MSTTGHLFITTCNNGCTNIHSFHNVVELKLYNTNKNKSHLLNFLPLFYNCFKIIFY